MEKKRVGYFVLFYIICFAILGVLIVCIRTGIGTGLSADVKTKLITAAIKTDDIEDAVSKAGDKISEISEKIGSMTQTGQEATGAAEGLTQNPGADTGSAGTVGILASTADIGLYDTDGAGKNYSFTYGGMSFNAYFNGESWTIYDSYRVTAESDMKIICQALIDVHPVLGRDRQSYRTADDMAYEWMQHNIAFEYVPRESRWYEHAKDVNLDPDDQGRSIEEIYEDRTGEKLDLGKIWEKLKQYY